MILKIDLRWRRLHRVRPRPEDHEFVFEVADSGLQRVPLLQDVAQFGQRKSGPRKNRSFGLLLQLLSGLRSGSPQAFGICEPPNQNLSVEFDIRVPSRVDPRMGTHTYSVWVCCFWFKQVHTKHFFFCYWSNICRIIFLFLTENIKNDYILQLHWDGSSFQWVFIE